MEFFPIVNRVLLHNFFSQLHLHQLIMTESTVNHKPSIYPSGGSISNIVSIGPAASRKKPFENVETTDR